MQTEKKWLTRYIKNLAGTCRACGSMARDMALDYLLRPDEEDLRDRALAEVAREENYRFVIRDLQERLDEIEHGGE